MVTPSQGSHFFQNLSSFQVGYFTVNSFKEEGFVDWDWLLNLQPTTEMTYTKHVRLDVPLIVRMNGHQNKGIIIKPTDGNN